MTTTSIQPLHPDCEVIDGQTFLIVTGEPPPIHTSCRCDENGLCHFPPCVKLFRTDEAFHAAVFLDEVRMSDEEARSVWAHRPGKAEAYISQGTS